jgi:hypothetical protein
MEEKEPRLRVRLNLLTERKLPPWDVLAKRPNVSNSIVSVLLSKSIVEATADA